MLRKAAVAGSFYPSDRHNLMRVVDECLGGFDHKKSVFGVIVPHAGYVYSGTIAGEVLGQIEVPRQVILLGPNHHGRGPDVSVSAAEFWTTPLGEVPINTTLAAQFTQRFPLALCEDQAHEYEHSLEVMLPFLQRLQPELQVLPVSLRSLRLTQCLEVARALVDIVNASDEEILLLASSDMNHFLTADENEKLDRLAIEAMTAYDPQALYQVVVERGISMCGFHAAVIVMEAARLLGADSCKLVNYAHSGLVNGDNSRVVGYAGLILE